MNICWGWNSIRSRDAFHCGKLHLFRNRRIKACELDQQERRYSVKLVLAAVLGILSPGAASAESDQDAGAIPDIIDHLCAAIAQPVTASELKEFSNYIVSGFSSNYTEVIGKFSDGRARSVRYLPNDNRTAQFVHIVDRRICLIAPGVDDNTCGVPLVCSSGEADYVMVDHNDKPFARIDRPKEADPEVPSLPEGHDWVTFSGGTVELSIAEELVGRPGNTPARNADIRGLCRVGRGHPMLDGAYAYYWSGNSCSTKYASGNGMIVYISNLGEIKTIGIGPEKGIQTRNGRLYWSFPDQPISVAIECSNEGDTEIPKSAMGVSYIKVELIVPSTVEIGESLIFEKLAAETVGYIERICGKAPIPNQTEFLIRSRPDEKDVYLALVWEQTKARPKNKFRLSAAFRRNTARDDRTQAVAISRFARFVRQLTEAERETAILSALRAASQLPNLANGMRESDVQTLVAMTKGMATWMPWAGQKPAYSNNEFRLSWRTSSQDPATEFFQQRRQHQGWAKIEARLPNSRKPQASINLTCIVTSKDAQELPSESWVLIDATMTSFSQNAMVLRCSTR